MVIGITGCPGSGKSVLARQLATSGWLVLDADAIGREVVETDTAVLRSLDEAFGPGIIGPDGALNRRELARRAFATGEGTRTLNAIVHPRLVELLTRRVNDHRRGGRDIAVDCALILEWDIGGLFDVVVCAVAEESARLARIMERDGRSEEDVRALFAAQLPQDVKAARSDIVLRNDGPLDRFRSFGSMLAALPPIS